MLTGLPEASLSLIGGWLFFCPCPARWAAVVQHGYYFQRRLAWQVVKKYIFDNFFGSINAGRSKEELA